ncbi:hypothetical protein, partial [Enterobacter asburiae]
RCAALRPEGTPRAVLGIIISGMVLTKRFVYMRVIALTFSLSPNIPPNSRFLVKINGINIIKKTNPTKL